MDIIDLFSVILIVFTLYLVINLNKKVEELKNDTKKELEESTQHLDILLTILEQMHRKTKTLELSLSDSLMNAYLIESELRNKNLNLSKKNKDDEEVILNLKKELKSEISKIKEEESACYFLLKKLKAEIKDADKKYLDRINTLEKEMKDRHENLISLAALTLQMDMLKAKKSI